MSLNRSGLIWPGGWSLPGPVTNVEFGKDSHANWILVPRARLLAPRCNSERWDGVGREGEGEGDDKGGRRASTKRNDANGWFICRDDEIARRYILSGGRQCLRIVECEIVQRILDNCVHDLVSPFVFSRL